MKSAPSADSQVAQEFASSRFGYAEVDGRVARTWHGYLLWLSPSESDLVRQLLCAGFADHQISAASWLDPEHPDLQQRIVDLPGLIARGVVRIVRANGGQRIALQLPDDTSVGPSVDASAWSTHAPSTCDDCQDLAERVVQADIISAMVNARGGKWLLRIDAPMPACHPVRPGALHPHDDAGIAHGALAGGHDGVHAYSTSWRGGSAEATRQRLLELVDVDCGIIAGIRRGSGLPEAIPVWFAGPNRALSTADPSGLTWRWPGNAMGKGLTDAEAQLSALAEAAERWSGTWQRSDGTEPVGGLDVVLGEEVRVSSEVVYMGHPPVAGVVRHTDSNGLAAGVTLADAQLQALLEIIERDAIAAWWEGDTSSRPASLTGSCLDALAPFVDWLAWLGLRVELRQLVSLAGTQTHLAVGWLPGSNRWLYGAGTHMDAGIAMRRAVLELVQSTVAALATPTQVAPTRGIRAELHPELPTSRRLSEERQVGWPSTGASTSPPGDVASAVTQLARTLAAEGYRTLAVDVTRPEVGVPVARVIVEGLRGMPLPMR